MLLLSTSSLADNLRSILSDLTTVSTNPSISRPHVPRLLLHKHANQDTEFRIISASGQESALNVTAYNIILGLLARKPGVLQEILSRGSCLRHPS
jgi:hypothetical protein